MGNIVCYMDINLPFKEAIELNSKCDLYKKSYYAFASILTITIVSAIVLFVIFVKDFTDKKTDKKPKKFMTIFTVICVICLIISAVLMTISSNNTERPYDELDKLFATTINQITNKVITINNNTKTYIGHAYTLELKTNGEGNFSSIDNVITKMSRSIISNVSNTVQIKITSTEIDSNIVNQNDYVMSSIYKFPSKYKITLDENVFVLSYNKMIEINNDDNKTKILKYNYQLTPTQEILGKMSKSKLFDTIRYSVNLKTIDNDIKYSNNISINLGNNSVTYYLHSKFEYDNIKLISFIDKSNFIANPTFYASKAYLKGNSTIFQQLHDEPIIDSVPLPLYGKLTNFIKSACLVVTKKYGSLDLNDIVAIAYYNDNQHEVSYSSIGTIYSKFVYVDLTILVTCTRCDLIKTSETDTKSIDSDSLIVNNAVMSGLMPIIYSRMMSLMNVDVNK